MKSLLIFFTVLAISLQIVRANELFSCAGLLSIKYVGTPLVTLTPRRYARMRKEIIREYEKQRKSGSLAQLLSFAPSINRNQTQNYELNYETSNRQGDTQRVFLHGRPLIYYSGVLRIATSSQEWLNFLATAIYRDDLTQLLREVRAYKVQLTFNIPEISSKPQELSLTPVDYQYSRRSNIPPYTPIEAYTQGYQTIVWGLSVDEVFKEITANYAFASSTAMNFLNTRLGFSIDRVIHKRFTDSIAEEILRGLGYSHSPSLQSEGYWQAREMTSGTLVYQKAIAALIKMNELGLVYIDSHLSAPNSSFKTGVVITRAQYEQTWALIQYPFTYLTWEPDVPIDGIYIYKGLALAIQAIENRGYRYIDGQGYVLAR